LSLSNNIPDEFYGEERSAVPDDNGQSGDDWFWQVVAQANHSPDRLREILRQFSKEQIYQFQDTFVEMSTELQDEPYTDYVDPDESEDGIEDIAHVVVSRGRDEYERVLSTPELMPAHVDAGDTSDLFHVAYEIYYDRFNEPLEVM
jgi:hypothetical protein